jgi:hypothetical protein
MVAQIKPSVTNPTIADIYTSIHSNQLILKPDFQRRFVWTHDHQEDFLETILLGYPFPEIYVCEGSVDTTALITTKLIIDGQQRLTTIKRFIEGVQDRKFKRIKTYSELSITEREDFLRYQIVVRNIGDVEEATIHEVFRRINLTKFKLDDIEIQNAIYDGEFIQCAKAILADVPLQYFGVFYESEFTRMADLHFVLLVMATLENGGYFPEDKLVEKNIVAFNEEYPRKVEMKRDLIRVFSVIENLKLMSDSIWLRKSNFFTLVTELTFHIEKIPEDLPQRLETLELKIMENRNDSDTSFGKYYSYMYSGTNQRKARVTRAALFKLEIFGESSIFD